MTNTLNTQVSVFPYLTILYVNLEAEIVDVDIRKKSSIFTENKIQQIFPFRKKKTNRQR